MMTKANLTTDILTATKLYLDITDTSKDTFLSSIITSILDRSTTFLGYKIWEDITEIEIEGNGRVNHKLKGLNLDVTKVEYKEVLSGSYTEIDSSEYIFYSKTLRLLNGLVFHIGYMYKITYTEGETSLDTGLKMVIMKAAASEYLDSNQSQFRLDKMSSVNAFGSTNTTESYNKYNLEQNLKRYELY